jgi:hypothetical protein
MVVSAITGLLSVIVDQRVIFGARVEPIEADPPLLVDRDTARAGPVVNFRVSQSGTAASEVTIAVTALRPRPETSAS